MGISEEEISQWAVVHTFNAVSQHIFLCIEVQCMQIFQNAGIHPSILRTARVESLISAVAVGEGISLFAESNFRLFQHEGVISVPLEESPVLRIGFAYKKAGE